MAYTITNKQREGALKQLQGMNAKTKLPEREKYWMDTLIGYLQPPTRNYYKFEDEEITLLSKVGIEENQMGIA